MDEEESGIKVWGDGETVLLSITNSPHDSDTYMLTAEEATTLGLALIEAGEKK